MFFKKHEPKPVPVNEINAMTRKGMSDKEIIKTLKSKGYSYNDIEKAMLSAVKSGVSEDKNAPRQQPQEQNDQPQDFTYDFGSEPQQESFDNMGTDDIFQGQQQQSLEDLPQLSAEQEQPVEELVEGVVEEKWQRFQDEMARYEEDLEKIRADMKVFEDRIEATKRESSSGESDAKFTELSDRMDELDARIGGLERAFKQFLPGLTRNIESLSALVNEIKAKQEPKSFASSSTIV